MMKTLKSLTKSIGFVLLVIFVIQVGGLTCANDIYAAGPFVAQGEQVIKTADLDIGADASLDGDLLYECQCPCHLNFSPIKSSAVSSYWITESKLIYVTKVSASGSPGEILQPPKI